MTAIITALSITGGGNMSKPTISACMPHRDYFQYIEGALTSLRLQKHPIQEIVVMDDGSDPKEWERLIKLWEEWPDGAPVQPLIIYFSRMPTIIGSQVIRRPASI
ncbi:MAG: glycosyltransferase [Planctomycetota bacterium]